jgi:hypothetical protein
MILEDLIRSHRLFEYNVRLKMWEKLWWRFMPGEVVKLKWPRGMVEVGVNSRAFDGTVNEIPQTRWSADPTDHYRPWLEANIGRKGWDWDWRMTDNDAAENRLTLKIRRKHSHHVTLIALKWS